MTDNTDEGTSSYGYENGVLTVNDGADITIGMIDGATSPTSDRIVVNGTATITLDEVRITSEGDASAIDLFAGAVLTLVAADQSSNSLTAESGGAYEDMGEPEIHVPEDAALIVLGEGSLSVTGGSSLTGAGGVGIGGKPGEILDDARNTYMAREEYAGSVLKQLVDTYAFMERCNRFRTMFEGLERTDYYDVPPVAMREALVNSVAHREYALSVPTLVSVMPGGMEIVSPGGPPLGIEEADLDACISIPRNKMLANILPSRSSRGRSG